MKRIYCILLLLTLLTIGTLFPLRSRAETAYRLSVIVAPENVASDGGTYPVYVQLQSLDGKPVEAVKDVKVKLFSSNTSVGTVTPEVVIASGTFYARALFNSTSIPGNTTITATADDTVSGHFIVKTRPPIGYPIKLHVTLLPENLTAGVGEEGYVVVELYDVAGRPAKAFSEVKVTLTSSNTSVCYVDSSLTVEAGRTFGVARFYASNLPGHSVITALAQNLESDTAEVHTLPYNGTTPSVKVRLFGVKTLRADMESYSLLGVQLQDAYGRPVISENGTVVYISSSKLEVGAVGDYVVVPKGKSYTLIEFRTTFKTGSTNITASATNHLPDMMTLQTVQPFPTILQAKVYPQPIVSDGGVYDLIVQLVDQKGNPALPEEDVKISLVSENTSIAYVERDIMLGKGRTYTTAAIFTGKAGETDVNVAAEGFTCTKARIKATPLPLDIRVAVSSEKVTVGENVTITAYVESQGARVKDAIVKAFSKDTIIWSGRTDDRGEAKIVYKPLKPGEEDITLTAYKKYYTNASETVKVYIEKFVAVTVKAEDTEGAGVAGVKVTVTSANGTITGFTNENGTVRFERIRWGDVKISVQETLASDETRYVFIQWAHGVENTTASLHLEEDKTLHAIYNVQHHVTVESPYGRAYGSGWYNKNSTITVGVTPTLIPINFFQKKVFTKWEGDISANTPTAQITVNTPKHIKAAWEDDYTNLYYTIALLAIIHAGIGTTLYIRRLKKK